MSTLPTREEAELADEFDSALWSDEWEIAADLVKARADGTLKTEQEFRDSLDYEAALIEFKKFWDRPFGGFHKDLDTMKAVIAAALGDSE